MDDPARTNPGEEAWATQHDILRPGDPNFVSFPKYFPDDCVEYDLYIVPTGQAGAESLVDSSGTAKDFDERLKSIKSAAASLVKTKLKDYIWQRDSISLTPVRPSKKSDEFSIDEPHLHGRTSFGECVADEWTVVWILRELSRQYTDLWIRVYDADDEFLLAEAAEKLPRWLEPEIAQHRIWIHGGGLRILGPTADWEAEKARGSSRNTGKEPMRQSSKSNKASSNKKRAREMHPISITEALQLIASIPADSIALLYPEVEASAFRRIDDYPGAIDALFHSTRVTLPRRLAYILLTIPDSISSAAEAIYLHDATQATKSPSSKAGSSRFPPTDLVTMRVKFNRVSYARLKMQEFETPAAWSHIVSKTRLNSNERALEHLVLGMKICTGFELLVVDRKGSTNHVRNAVQMLLNQVESGEDTLPTDEQIQSLSHNGKEDDDEYWLDVEYNEFEREMSSSNQDGASKVGEGVTGAFKDKAAEETLKRMMRGFEDLMKDEDFDDDHTDDEDDSNDSNDRSETDGKNISRPSNGATLVSSAQKSNFINESNPKRGANISASLRMKDAEISVGDVKQSHQDAKPHLDALPNSLPANKDIVEGSSNEKNLHEAKEEQQSLTNTAAESNFLAKENASESTSLDEPYDSDASDASDIALIMSTIEEEMRESGGTLDLSHLGISSGGSSGSIGVPGVDDTKARRALARKLLQSFRGLEEDDQ